MCVVRDSRTRRVFVSVVWLWLRLPSEVYAWQIWCPSGRVGGFGGCFRGSMCVCNACTLGHMITSMYSTHTVGFRACGREAPG